MGPINETSIVKSFDLNVIKRQSLITEYRLNKCLFNTVLLRLNYLQIF